MKTTLKINKKLPTLEVRVGWFGDRERKTGVLTNAQVALKNQKLRPFWAVWKKEYLKIYKKSLILIFQKYAFKKNDELIKSYGQLGVKMRNDLQSVILNKPWKPNAPSTILQKKSNKPLIASAQLFNGIRVVISIAGKIIMTL